MAITNLTGAKLKFLDVVNLENGTWQINFKSNNQNFTNFKVYDPSVKVETGYLTFSSDEPFSVNVTSNASYDGSLEYSTDTTSWTEVTKGTDISSVDNKVYLRGSNNTRCYIPTSGSVFKLTGSNIKCEGNIETLLDYNKVLNGEHPTTNSYTYSRMFYGCTNLVQAPDLPATTLADNCYKSMFYNCTSLTTAPALPATTLAEGCYGHMFYGCTNLVQAPAILPATEMFKSCCANMFYGCKSLTTAPALPATTLASACYQSMFDGCTNLVQAPDLPATTLANYCYQNMFYNCESLTTAPALPATTLADSCYNGMFSGCTNLVQAPALPATTLADSCYNSMFSGCTNLVQAPALPATELVNNCYNSMFSRCTNLAQIPALPATELVNNCYNSMFRGCKPIKLSTTQLDEYPNEYRIPSGSATGTTVSNALAYMFSNTGGTFTGTPEINTVYYTSNEIIQ